MVIRDSDPRNPNNGDSADQMIPGISPVSEEDPTTIPPTTGNGGIGKK